MTFVNMERIEKRFNNQTVLRDVSLKMNRGEIVSIIGPSGSGKSTFLRCLGQLETIDGGSITVDGTILASTENGIVKYASPQTQHELLLRMGMVFQSFNLFPHMTVMENLTLAQTKVRKTSMEEAKKIAANGIKYYIEVANMPTTNEALRFLMDQKNMVVAPSKAVNAGGVLVSGLEMSQNSERYSWTAEEVDSKLHQIMTGIHDGSAAAAEKYGLGYNLVAGANIVGFQKVADAMMAQGICW